MPTNANPPTTASLCKCPTALASKPLTHAKSIFLTCQPKHVKPTSSQILHTLYSSLASSATTEALPSATINMSRYLTKTPSSSQDIATLAPTYGKVHFNLLRKRSLIQHGCFLILSITPTVHTTCQHKLTWSPTCMPPMEAPARPHGSRPSIMDTLPLGQASPPSLSTTKYQNPSLLSKAT
jgi:hypothetical protein